MYEYNYGQGTSRYVRYKDQLHACMHIADYIIGWVG